MQLVANYSRATGHATAQMQFWNDQIINHGKIPTLKWEQLTVGLPNDCGLLQSSDPGS